MRICIVTTAGYVHGIGGMQDHTVELARGLVADIGGRLAEFASAGEVLVSRTVVDLVAGSGLRFSDRGSHRLAEGVPAWRVYSVE